jgi:hypothetical protein
LSTFAKTPLLKVTTKVFYKRKNLTKGKEADKTRKLIKCLDVHRKQVSAFMYDFKPPLLAQKTIKGLLHLRVEAASMYAINIKSFCANMACR